MANAGGKLLSFKPKQPARVTRRGKSPTGGPLVASIIARLEEQLTIATMAHTDARSDEASLAAGAYACAVRDCLEIVQHAAELLASKPG